LIVDDKGSEEERKRDRMSNAKSLLLVMITRCWGKEISNANPSCSQQNPEPRIF
jgi:hypothetical protein